MTNDPNRTYTIPLITQPSQPNPSGDFGTWLGQVSTSADDMSRFRSPVTGALWPIELPVAAVTVPPVSVGVGSFVLGQFTDHVEKSFAGMYTYKHTFPAAPSGSLVLIWFRRALGPAFIGPPVFAPTDIKLVNNINQFFTLTAPDNLEIYDMEADWAYVIAKPGQGVPFSWTANSIDGTTNAIIDVAAWQISHTSRALAIKALQKANVQGQDTDYQTSAPAGSGPWADAHASSLHSSGGTPASIDFYTAETAFGSLASFSGSGHVIKKSGLTYPTGPIGGGYTDDDLAFATDIHPRGGSGTYSITATPGIQIFDPGVIGHDPVNTNIFQADVLEFSVARGRAVTGTPLSGTLIADPLAAS